MKHFTLFILLTVVSVANATTFTVTNTNDSGSGSLRYALQIAAFTSGPHTIQFNISTSDANYNSTTGVWVITPASTFDYITKNNVTIDGTTQTQNQGNTNPNGPEIVLDGNDNSINYCFSVINASNTVIKGFNIRDFMYGIQVYGTSATNAVITENYIGTNETATDTAGNYIGIEIISGANYTQVNENIISGNEHIGLRLLDVSYCVVTGNYVGVNRTGMSALSNYDGISLEGAVKFCIIGGTNPNERNIISGNVAYGLPVFGAGAESNRIIGNYIGTDITGTQAIPNTYGVLFDDGSFNNTLGGNTSAERNILSGNSSYGVFIYNMGTHSNIVKGNFIGTDINGTTAIPNAVGIVIDGAAYKHIIDSNIISGNLQQGIYINITGSDSTSIIKNKIGVDINGNALGNGSDGIRISQGPKHSLIGGSPEKANIIANNGGSGVYIMFPDDDNHLISCNSIYNNTGLGIDIFPQGVNQNDVGDGDSGANQEMNYPEIDTVIFTYGTGETTISGTIDTQNPGTVLIQIYRAVPDLSGHGQGIEYLSSISPNNSGNWTYTTIGLSASDFITTIAIDPNNNTSEFSVSRNSTTIANIEKNSADKIKIYPNPSNGIFVVSGERINSIKILNIEGKIIKQIQTNSNYTSIDISSFDSGIYFLKVFTYKDIVSKIIILK